ncbi:MAG: TatD family hydrolase [Dehalococcoidia bacterium]|nr:TatD family hydrolase [Dehalococcoidia bacterium]
MTDLAANPGVVKRLASAVSRRFWARLGLQAETFLAQASIARNTELALVLHIDGDGAWDQLATRGTHSKACVWVRHYFTGDSVQAAWHAERGHFVSFGNPLRRTSQLQEITARYPPELLLIETDSYPAPGRITQPADVVKVAEALAGSGLERAGNSRATGQQHSHRIRSSGVSATSRTGWRRRTLRRASAEVPD